MAIKKAAPPQEEISQSSLSDIAFLLLVFFIATTIFPTEKGIPLILPSGISEKTPINRKNVMVITCDAGGSVFVDDESIALRILRDEVVRRLAENEKLVISIETHPDAAYASMMAVLDKVKMAEATRISIKMFRGV